MAVVVAVKHNNELAYCALFLLGYLIKDQYTNGKQNYS